MSCELTNDDLLELSKVYAPEYNMPEFHDRVLVFDVMRDGWDVSGVLMSACKKADGQNPANDDKKLFENPSVTSEHFRAGKESAHAGAERAKVQQFDEGKAGKILSVNETKSEPGSALPERSNFSTSDVPFVASLSLSRDANPVCFPVSSVETTAEPVNNLLRQHSIFVHSSCLAVQSKYFRSLFLSGMKESKSKEVHFKVPESEEKAHLTLIEAIYKADIINDASVDELLAVLELADKYDVRFVFRKCKYVLQMHNKTFENSRKIAHVIKVKHNMMNVENLAATSRKVLAKHFSPLDNNWQSESFLTLSEPLLRYLLSSDDLTAQSENTVFHALMHWMECNDVDPCSLEPTSNLLATIRFEFVTIDFLHNVIKHHPIATKMPGFQELFWNGMSYIALPSKQQELLLEKPARRILMLGTSNIVQYSWNVEKNTLTEAVETRTSLQSDVFWCCGYKMWVELKNIKLISWGFTLFAILNVLELKKESLLSIWVKGRKEFIIALRC